MNVHAHDPLGPVSRDERVHGIGCASPRAYDVRLTERVLDPTHGALAGHLAGRKTLIVTTPTVAALYDDALARFIAEAPGVTASLMVLECTEEKKTLGEVAAVCREALARGLDRKSVLVGVGGGVCTDIVSVAAAGIRRGIGCVRVPTTLIGQIDAGIGLKGAVNFSGKKSYLGCFYPPEAVFVDPAFLRTVPARLMAFGFAEVIKMALVRDHRLFELVEAHHAQLTASRFKAPLEEGRQVLRLAIKRMLEELETNPYEDRSYKRLVDMGHTFSPALEAASGFAMHHGQAVAIDTALTVTLCEQLGLLAKAERDRVIALIRAVGLPITSELLTLDRCRQGLDEAVLHRGGAVNLVAPTAIGEATFIERREEVTSELLEQALARLAFDAAASGMVAA